MPPPTPLTINLNRMWEKNNAPTKSAPKPHNNNESKRELKQYVPDIPKAIQHREQYLAKRASLSSASSSSLGSASSSTSINEEVLNPHAAPFVPSLPPGLADRLGYAAPRTRKKSPPAFVEYQDMEDQMLALTMDTMSLSSGVVPVPAPAEPAWTTAFLEGTYPGIDLEAGPEYLSQKAHELVWCACPWDPEDMAYLALQFCWRGVDSSFGQPVVGPGGVGEKDDVECVAQFALEVYHCFLETRGDELARSFLWHLRECVIGAFKANCDPIAREQEPDPSARLSLASFVGVLSAMDLIAPHQIGMCMTEVLDALSSYEHICAIARIIKRAGPELWRNAEDYDILGKAVHQYLDIFVRRASCVPDRFGHGVQKVGEVGSVIGEVVDVISMYSALR